MKIVIEYDILVVEKWETGRGKSRLALVKEFTPDINLSCGNGIAWVSAKMKSTRDNSLKPSAERRV